MSENKFTDYESIPNRFDDKRILNGEVSEEEKIDLEGTLLTMYLEMAKEAGQEVKILNNAKEYMQLKKTKEVFKKDKFYLLLDEKNEQLLDIGVIVHRLIDTEEGFFYSKLMQL